MGRHVILWKNVISIMICSRESWQHILVEEHLEGVGSDQFALWNENYETLFSCGAFEKGLTCTFCPHQTLACFSAQKILVL
jgi:hypothetical protein